MWKLLARRIAEQIVRVKHVVLQELVGASMQGVRSTLRDDV